MWVAPWSDLFPWLASGVSNTIDDTSEAASIARFRMMQQDFLALGRIYQIAANLQLNFKSEPNFSPREVQQIADNFYARFADLAQAGIPTSNCLQRRRLPSAGFRPRRRRSPSVESDQAFAGLRIGTWLDCRRGRAAPPFP